MNASYLLSSEIWFVKSSLAHIRVHRSLFHIMLTVPMPRLHLLYLRARTVVIGLGGRCSSSLLATPTQKFLGLDIYLRLGYSSTQRPVHVSRLSPYSLLHIPSVANGWKAG